MEQYWDSFVAELHHKIGEPSLLRIVVFSSLLNGQWEVVSCFDRDTGIDHIRKGLKITPPSKAVQSLFQQHDFLIQADFRKAYHLYHLLPEEIREKTFYLFHHFPDSTLLFLFVLTEDRTESIKKTLRELSSSLAPVHALWNTHNQKLVLDRFLISLISLLRGVEPYTYHHSLRVALLAAGTAARLSLSPEHQEEVRVTGLIHDLGKLFVPKEILLKRDRLTREEFEEVKQHIFMLDGIFLGNEFMEKYVPLARLHHERLDGSGYLGLTSESIPIESRIIAVCDVFDAMLHNRPYREAYSLEEVIRELILMGEIGKLDMDAIKALLAEIPDYYLSPVEERSSFLLPGLDLTLRKVTPGAEAQVPQIYPGRIGEVEGNRISILFPSEVPLAPDEEVLLSYELSYSLVEITARYLSRDNHRYFFLLGHGVKKRRTFSLPWSLELRFLKVAPEKTAHVVREIMRNPAHLLPGRTEIIGGERIVFLTEDTSLRVNDTVVLLFEAYGEHFLVPGRVTRIENLGFAQQVFVEDFALPEREIDRLYGLLFRRQSELRSGFTRYTF